MTGMQKQALTPPERWTELLRERGLRATSGRVIALCYIEAEPHCTAGHIREALAHEHPALSQQSVHNIVNDLTEVGLLRRIDLPGTGSALYETRTDDNHHHVQCVICHRIEDIDCVVGEAPCMQPSHTHGMRLLEAAVTFRGVCASCDAAGGVRELSAGADGEQAPLVAASTERTAPTRRAGTAEHVLPVA